MLLLHSLSSCRELGKERRNLHKQKLQKCLRNPDPTGISKCYHLVKEMGENNTLLLMQTEKTRCWLKTSQVEAVFGFFMDLDEHSSNGFLDTHIILTSNI